MRYTQTERIILMFVHSLATTIQHNILTVSSHTHKIVGCQGHIL